MIWDIGILEMVAFGASMLALGAAVSSWLIKKKGAAQSISPSGIPYTWEDRRDALTRQLFIVLDLLPEGFEVQPLSSHDVSCYWLRVVHLPTGLTFTIDGNFSDKERKRDIALKCRFLSEK